MHAQHGGTASGAGLGWACTGAEQANPPHRTVTPPLPCTERLHAARARVQSLPAPVSSGAMPPPQAVICEVCGGKFFKHSYAHHLKQCIKKKEAQTVMCDWCGHAISKDEYASHTPACKAAHKGRKAKPRKGASAVSDRAKKKLAAMEEAKAAGKSAADIAMPPDKSMLGGVFDPFANLDVRFASVTRSCHADTPAGPHTSTGGPGGPRRL